MENYLMTNQIRLSLWDRLFMRFATDVSNMSHAIRLNVGAVAVRDKRVIAIGYNDTPSGEDNCCEIIDKTNFGKLITKTNVVHAEANLIKYAKENNIDLYGCTLYITHSPCPSCGQLVIDTGFSEVVFGKHYRIVSDLSKLTEAGINVREYN